jgi:hypothetical protein
MVSRMSWKHCTRARFCLFVVGLWLTVLGCSGGGCSGRGGKMRSLEEIRAFGMEKIPIGGHGASWPIPIVENGTLRAAVFWFRCAPTPGDPWVGPPYRLVVVNVDTAEVVRSTLVAPRDVGPDAPPGAPLPGRTSVEVTSVDEGEKLQARMSALAPTVWSAFGAGRATLSDQERHDVAEYVSILDRTEPKQLLPYYRGVGKAFYEWAARAQGAVKK